MILRIDAETGTAALVHPLTGGRLDLRFIPENYFRGNSNDDRVNFATMVRKRNQDSTDFRPILTTSDCFFDPHHEKRRRKRIGDRGRRCQNSHGQHSFHRPARFGVENVTVSLSLVPEELNVRTACG